MQRRYILEARRNKEFLKLDDEVRALTIAIGRSADESAKRGYLALVKKRDKMLNDFIEAIEPRKQLSPINYKNLDSYCEKFPNTKKINLVFIGATGTGKTFVAKKIAQNLHIRGFKVGFYSAYSIIKKVRFEDLENYDLLIIDDLGTEPDQKNTMEYLYAVIAERYESDRSFIITSNLSTEQILETYGQRIFGRIFDKNKTAVITFEGDDKRI
ncbi:MAG: ATP-binding protein [Christensenellaceae bacterium]|jgi:DNA replication protein DnaC|nr:ATP-binding protein [Christensenellaceae bacterium]